MDVSCVWISDFQVSVTGSTGSVGLFLLDTFKAACLEPRTVDCTCRGYKCTCAVMLTLTGEHTCAPLLAWAPAVMCS